MRSEIGGTYDVECPYFPSTFDNIGGINGHIYNKICPEVTKKCVDKTWPRTRHDICKKNNSAENPIGHGSVSNNYIMRGNA